MIFSLFKRRAATLPKSYKSLVDSEAIAIVKDLQSAGHEAYLVGGCVRDILLEKKSKDFDIATSATPDEVKSSVRRSRIIGKRFQIVLARRSIDFRSLSNDGKVFPYFYLRPPSHEYEITTFRREPEWDEEAQKLNENVFGDARADALRRDFTVNALLLDPLKSKIVDFVGGNDDIKKRVLRMIGDPFFRFEEDPIRILRAVRFKYRNGLEPEKQTLRALNEKLDCLKEAKKERVREEILKIWREGHTDAVFGHMFDIGLWKIISPLFHHRLEKDSVAKKQLMSIADAVKDTPWNHPNCNAPYFFLMGHDHLLGRNKKDASKFTELFTKLNLSKKENEDIQRIRETIKRCQSEKSAGRLRSMRTSPSSYSRFAQGFFTMKVLADAKIEDFPKLWKLWRPIWSEYRDECKKDFSRPRKRNQSRGRRKPAHRSRRARPKSKKE